jgi:hypothetical protein
MPSFFFGNSKLEVADHYTYLGIIFNYNDKFNKAQKKLYDQANKAMFALIAKARRLSLPIDVQFSLFDSLVLPILIYGCEIWGSENCSLIEKLHLRFCKIILNCKSSTANCMVLGELGRFPIINHIKSRMVNFWSSIVNMKECRLSKIMYRLVCKLHDHAEINSSWINMVKNTITGCGFNYIWTSQTTNHPWVKTNVKLRINDQFVQNWNSNVFNSSSCTNYRIFKSEFKLENYLLRLPHKYAISLCRYRLSNSRIPIVTGRYFNISYDDRICTLCNANIIGDEFHYIFECKFFKLPRSKFIDHNYYFNPNSYKMHQLFNSENTQTLINLSKFIKEILVEFKLS